LPNELLYMICAKFCSHCTDPTNDQFRYNYRSSQVISRLSKTCKRLRDIAQPVLYHYVYPKEIWLFLRTIMVRPDLAAQVRSFRHDLDSNINYEAEDPDTIFDPWINQPRRKNWLSQFEGIESLDEFGIRRWLIESILTRLPNARQLFIDVPLYRRSTLGTLVDFSSVTRLVFMPPIHLGRGYLRDFLSTMPYLEELALAVLGNGSEFLHLPELRFLELFGYDIGAETLMAIIGSCPKLERFGFYGEPGLENFRWDQVQRILHQRRETLKHLKFRAIPYFLDEDYEVMSDRGSFRGFDGLETLYMNAESFNTEGAKDFEALFPIFPADVVEMVDLLPESLLCLGFYDLRCQWKGIDVLAQAIREGHFPRLKTVYLTLEGADLEESRSILAAVGVACKS
ncbi:hypothetical protein BBK36DRAFT_1087766, partial [Trichoderma citrinoviride]